MLLLLVAVAGGIAGCGARTEYGLTALRISRTGWDTLAVAGVFTKRVAWGSQPVQPDTTVIRLFDVTRDTLYAGPLPADGRLPVPDAALGDRTLMLVEMCGHFGEIAVCGQRGVRASPKHARVQAVIVYPAKGDFSRGRYRLQFSLERKRFGQAAWERIAPDASGPPEGYLLAYVRGHRPSAVRVPFAGRAGTFRLVGRDGWEDFAFHLHAAFFEADTTEVIFEVYAARGRAARPVARVRKTVQARSRSVHRTTVRYVVQQAVQQVVRRLAGEEEEDGERRVIVYIDRWTYDRFDRRYEVALEMHWRKDDFDEEAYRLSGMLEMGVSGTPARFRLTGGNRAARRRWEAAVAEPMLQLKAIETMPPDSLRAAHRDDRRPTTDDR